nr:hypothetical protein [Tanacetum cinerariifolium]
MMIPNTNFSKDPSKVTAIELTASMIAVNNLETSVSLLLFSRKKKKGKSQIVSKPKSKTQGPKASGSLPQKRKKAMTKKTTPEATETPPTEEEPTEDSDKTQPGKTTDLKDSGGHVQPADKGLLFTIFDEVTGKTKPLPKGPREEKYSERLKPLVDMESQSHFVTALSGTNAKYQLDSQPLVLSTVADVQALLLSDDELVKESKDDVFEAGDEMNEDIQQDDKEETQSPKPSKESSTEVPSEEPVSQEHYPPVAPKTDRGKGIATDETKEPTKKLVLASRKVRHDPDAPTLVPYEINRRMYQLTKEQIQAHLDKEEMLKKYVKEVKRLEISKPELIKVVQEEATKAGVKKEKEIRQKRIDNYIWKTINRLKPEPITEVKIHSNSKPAVITVYIDTDRRNFEVCNPFEFGNFRLTELDELGPIIEKKKNKIVGELMISLRRKRKKMELEPEIRIPVLEYNMSLPEGVSFVNNMVIEEPEYKMFFIDVFGNEAFQRTSDINKVGIDTLITYLVIASNITTPKNKSFCQKLRKLIVNHPEQEKLKSKKVKLEYVGYKLD